GVQAGARAILAGGAVVAGPALPATILLLSKPSDQTEPAPPGAPASAAVHQKPPTGPGPAAVKPPDLPPSRFTNSLGMTLLRIPKGRFLMGSPLAEQERNPNETQHEVNLTRPFYLGAYLVTQEQYQRVMGKNPSHFSRTGAGKVYVQRIADDDLKRFPVENVSWEEAVTFCRKLSELPEEKRLGRVYRLPSEAEWEYACRAGTSTPFHFGAKASGDEANFSGHAPYNGAPKGPYLSRTARVGSYPPNAWGLFDMHGNVWEWCSDRFEFYYTVKGPRKDPRGPDSGKQRSARGGSWGNQGRDCRSAVRGAFDP